MPGVFVTATGTDVGKTFVACALIRALRADGREVDALKPVLSGYTDYEGSDAERLATALGRGPSELNRISPLRFGAPLAPSSAARIEGRPIDFPDLVARCRSRLDEAEWRLLLIEGAGGVMSPIAEGATNLDLMDELGLPAILVTGTYLGAVSHTLTASHALGTRNIELLAIVVSETEKQPFMIAEMTEALETFVPGIPVIVARRDPDWTAEALVPHV